MYILRTVWIVEWENPENSIILVPLNTNKLLKLHLA